MSGTQKNFIRIRDFYNFIKKPSGENSPATFYYFSVALFRESNEMFIDPLGQKLFSDANLERFRYAIQQVQLPKIVLKGFEDAKLSAGSFDIDNLYGAMTLLKNAFINAGTRTIQVRLLNFQKPLIEEFIMPWFNTCIQNSYKSTTFPRLNMKIKFWGGNVVEKAFNDENDSTHTFEYFITGMFPIDMELYSPIQSAQSSNDNRTVTFGFNEIRGGLRGHLTQLYQAAQNKTEHNNTTINPAEEAAAARAAAAQAAINQRRDAHNLLTDMIGNAAGGATGGVLQNWLGDIGFNGVNPNEKRSESPKNGNKKSDSGKPQTTPTESTKTNPKDKVEAKPEIKDDQKQTPKETPKEKDQIINENKTNVVPKNNNDSFTNFDDYVNEEKHKNKENEVDLDELTPIKTGKIMTFGVNDVTLNQERNVSSEDSNLSIDENKKIVEDKNIDDGFEEIVESDNEDNLAFESTSNTQKFNDSISNIEPELIINDVEKDNNSINNTNKEIDLNSSEIVNSYKQEEGNHQLESGELVKTNSYEFKSSDEVLNELHTQIASHKEKYDKVEISGSEIINLTNSITNINNENKIQDLIKSYKDNQYYMNKSNLETPQEIFSKIANQLVVSDVSGSVENVKSLISSLKSKNKSYSINDNIKDAGIKTNLSLVENESVVETLNIDDGFEEIVDSDNEVDVAQDSNNESSKDKKSFGNNKDINAALLQNEKDNKVIQNHEKQINVEDFTILPNSNKIDTSNLNKDKVKDLEKSVKSLKGSKILDDETKIDNRKKENLSLEDNQSLAQNKNIDDGFEEIIDTDDESELAKTSKGENNINSADSLGMNKSINDVSETSKEIAKNVKILKSQNEITKEELIDSIDSNVQKYEDNNIDLERYSIIPNSNKIDLKKLDELRIEELEKSVAKLKSERELDEKINVETKKKSPFIGNTFELDQVDNEYIIKPTISSDLDHFGISDVKETSSIINNNVNAILSEEGDFRNISGDFSITNTKRITDEVGKGIERSPQYIPIKDGDYERLIPKTPTTMTLIENQSLVENMNVDDEFGEILDPEIEFDVNNMYEVLKDNKSINVTSYEVLNNYANNTNQGVNDVVKQYKSTSNSDLPKLISEIIKTNLGIDFDVESFISKDYYKPQAETQLKIPENQKEIVKDYKKSSKLEKTKGDIQTNMRPIIRHYNEKVKSSDLDDLFS